MLEVILLMNRNGSIKGNEHSGKSAERRLRPIKRVITLRKELKSRLLCLLLLMGALFPQPLLAANPHHTVLLVHSYHSGMPWTDAQHKGYADSLRNSGLTVDIHVEYLDSLRHRQQTDVMRDNLRRTLLSKFKDNPPEVIAVTDNNALDYILEVRQQLAPEAPVVFCGINGLDQDIRNRYQNLTGVAEEASFKETLELMEQLLPGRRVLVLGEDTPTFQRNLERLHQANERRRTPAQLDLFNDPVLSRIEARVQRAGSDTVVFLMNRPVNEEGETLDSPAAIRAISEASKQPLFSAWEYMFGHGIVGGKLTSGEAQGQAAAHQVIRILQGEAADSIPIQWESPNRYFLDYEQLLRFDLQDRPLPEGSQVINSPPSLYERHGEALIAGAVALVLLLLLEIRLMMVGKSLRLSRDLLDNIVDNIPVMVFVKRASDLRFVVFNRAGETLLGSPRERMLGRGDYDFFPKEQADFFVAKDREVLQRSDVLDIAEEPIDTPNGTRILHTKKLALRNKEGKPVYLLGISEDITERKQAEQALERNRDELEETVQRRTSELSLARDAAEAANKAKSAFLANMSHELRTPLNAILGFSHMMQSDKSLTSAQHETLDIINSSGVHLLRLINDVLEITKIEAGKLQLQVSTFDLYALLREVLELIGLRAHQKGLQLELEQAQELPRYIKGDEARLRQILVNLVSNAVKFTDKGQVNIRVGVKDNLYHHLLIEVEDTGPGISAADRQRLFQPFVQLVDGTVHEGVGLGLAIVQQFVQLMEGSVSIESEIGVGSLFRVELPLEAAEATEVTRLSGMRHGEVTGLIPGQPSYRILIAEDQHDNWLLLSRLMAKIGLQVKVAENGEECVRLFKEWKPDLIWMDRRMPVTDGVEATRRIRQLPDGDKVKVIAVTASAFKEEQQELHNAGMDGCVSKPYRFEEIYNSLEQHLGLRFHYAEAIPEQPAPLLDEEKLAVLPEAVCRKLRQALESLEPGAIDAAIHWVGEHDAELAGNLSRIAEGLDYQAILNALQEAQS
jgi:PAS domain S-box-containing protein